MRLTAFAGVVLTVFALLSFVLHPCALMHRCPWYPVRRVDVLELPRLQLSFTAKRDVDDGVMRLYSDDHLGYFLSQSLTPGIRRLLDVC